VDYYPTWTYGYDYYGVSPVYWYDPWDPFVAGVAVGALCIALW
jgi:hypothetical protein